MENKVCTKCGKPFKKRPKSKISQCKDCWREYLRKWRALNPEKSRENSYRWRRNNPEKWKESQKRTEEKEGRKEYKIDWERQRIKNDPEFRKKRKKQKLEWNKRNPEKIRECNNRWRRNNPEKHLELVHRNRAKRKSAFRDTVTKTQWQKILKSHKHRCAICGRKFSTRNKPTIDHIVPLSKRGCHSSDNLQPVCLRCNQMKNASLDPEYIQSWIYAKEEVVEGLYNG